MKNIILLIVSTALLSSCIAQESGMPELYALRYGISHTPTFNVFSSGPPHGGPVAWMFWLFSENESITLIDCGIHDSNLLERWEVEEYVSPASLVEQLGIDNEEVTRIILSHGHGDHLDGCSKFPNAVVIMQEKEFNAMRSAFKGTGESQTTSKGYYRKHLEFLEEKREKGQLRLMDGDKQISIALSVELAPYHTRGTQTIVIETKKGRTILVPDNAYITQNIADARPVGSAVSKEGNRAYLKKLKTWQAYPRTTVIPGHDMKVFEAFPLIQKNIARIQ